MKTVLRILACALVVCGLTSCPETTVDDDFGLKPEVLNTSDWNGDWTPVDDDDVLHLVVTDAAKGLLVVTEPGKKDDKPVEISIREASADKKEKLCFAVVRDPKAKKTGESFMLFRVADDGVLFSWSIDHDAVADAIKAGQLKGTVKPDKDGAHSHLDSTPANYTRLLEPRFWKWSEPACLKRVKK